jgi:hypothetical protein
MQARLRGTADGTANGSLNFNGTAIDNIRGLLHFRGTEDSVEDGSLDLDEGKVGGSLDSDGTTCFSLMAKHMEMSEACPTLMVQKMAWTMADLSRISSMKASSMAQTQRHSRWNSWWLH